MRPWEFYSKGSTPDREAPCPLGERPDKHHCRFSSVQQRAPMSTYLADCIIFLWKSSHWKWKEKKRYPYALTWKEIYYILLNKNAGIWTAWVVWLHLCQNMEGKLSMRYMQIKFLEGYTRKQTVVASGEMRLRCRWWKRESLLHGTLHSSPPFDFSREHVLER